MIIFEHVTTKIDGKKILDKIDLNIAKGQTVGILGPSGGGKSTLMRNINMLTPHSSGHIYYNKQKLTARTAKQLTKKIGMAFQNFNLFPHMSVLENLTYGPIKVNNIKPSEAEEKARRLLERFSLSSKINEMPNSLSGGQKQRVAIARSLMMEPEVMLYDEPTSALDIEVVGDIVSIIRDLKDQGMTQIIVSHQIDLLRACTDQIVFMDQGKVLEVADTKEFFKKPKSHRARLFLEKVLIAPEELR